MPTPVGESSDTQAALAEYSKSLHKFTQELWLEARRKAEAQATARRRMDAQHKRPSNDEEASKDSQV